VAQERVVAGRIENEGGRVRSKLASSGALFVVMAISGCSAAGLGNPAANVPNPPFPECGAESYDFVGEGTLAGIGLDETVLPAAPPDPDRTATIWVTSDRRPSGQGQLRMLCFEFDDGSGGSEWPVADTWVAPGALNAMAEGVWPTAVSVGVLLGVAALVVAVSVVAFRRGGSRDDR
jgi:hypothetical protein